MKNMNYSVSETAEYGGYVTGPRVINAESKAAMKDVLKEIQNGTFAKNWLLENKVGQPNFKGLRRESDLHPIEKVGAELRKLFVWDKDAK